MNIRPVEAELLHAHGQTVMTKLIFAFCNSAQAHERILHCVHTLYLCFVCIAEQTAIISVYRIG